MKLYPILALSLVACGSSGDDFPPLGDYIPPDGGDASALVPPTHLGTICGSCPGIQCQCAVIPGGNQDNCNGQPRPQPFVAAIHMNPGQTYDWDLGISDSPTVCGGGYVCATKEDLNGFGTHYTFPDVVNHDVHWKMGSESAYSFDFKLNCWPMIFLADETYAMYDVQANAGQGEVDTPASSTYGINTWAVMAGWGGSFTPGTSTGSFVGINSGVVNGVTVPVAMAYSAPSAPAAWGRMLVVKRPPGTIHSAIGSTGPLVTLFTNAPGLSECGFVYNEGPSNANLGLIWSADGKSATLGSANGVSSVSSASCVY